MKDEHTNDKKMARNGRNTVIYKGTFVSNHSLEGKKSKTLRAVKNQQNMLFAASERGSPLIMPRPFLGCQIKAKIKGFLLMYRLFLY